MKENRFYTTFARLLLISGLFSAAGAAQTPQEQARHILDATGVKGGLIVHFGCGDGRLTAALHDNNSYYVHGLDSDEGNVAAARAYIQSQGFYGDAVMVEHFDGDRLPYIENLVNLLVSEQPLPFDPNEILRVLAPNGIAYVKDGIDWTMTVKPRPPEIDDWTHHLYDATNNAVSHDTVVEPPKHFQWIGSPKWSRHHDRIGSVTGHVSANGRNYYIVDEGSKASPQLPAKWRLYARDAFNGTILWSKPIGDWIMPMWPIWSGPTQLARRLVAVDDALYVTLGLDGAGLSKVDGATGAVLWTEPSTVMTEEIIYSDGALFAMIKDNPPETGWNSYRPKPVWPAPASNNVAAQFPWDEQSRKVAAIDPNNGSIAWQVSAVVAPMTLAADSDSVYFHNGISIVCLDRTDGSPNWTSVAVARQSPMPPRFGPTLVVNGDCIMFAGGDANRTITSLSAETGAVLWSSQNHPISGVNCPHDLFVINGQAWMGETAQGGYSGNFTSWDLNTGASTLWPSDTDIFFMHHRCHRAMATVKYILPSRTGIEFVDTTTGHWIVNHWTRSGCNFGLVPANGLINITPHSCACYVQSKTYGFAALAPAHSDPDYPQTPAPASRLIQGPAYNEPLGADAGAEDWPTYRGDSFRTGHVESFVPSGLIGNWQADIGGKLSTMTIANGNVYVASVDTHTLYALNESNGHTLWTFVAGGRIDSPPTVYKERVIFGSADGYVYCLRATDGVLIWRFQAAPENLRMTSMEQVESVWPLHGSVLVINDEIYCVAGRLMFLDGGLRFLRIDPNTGVLIDEIVLDEKDPDTGQNLQTHVKNMNMPVAMPDILSSDGEWIFMRQQRFDMQGNRYEIIPISSDPDTVSADQYGVGVHLFSSFGFLDDFYMHRTYWIWGRSWNCGSTYARSGRYAPAGRVMAIGPDRVYGYGRKDEFFVWSVPLEYKVFCAEKYPESETIEYHWKNTDIPILANSIVLTDEVLWVAGPPDLVDEVAAYNWWSMDPSNPSYDPTIPTKLSEQDAALNDQRGGLVRAVAIEDGSTLAEYNLESIPVWDGMIAANGQLYIAMANGKIKCFKNPPEVDAGDDMITWSGEPVSLDATVGDEGMSDLTYAWSANPSEGVVFDPNAAVEDPTVTITKATANPSTVTLTLAVSDAGNPTPVTDSMTIDVYDDACKATIIGKGLAADNPTDLDNNCITDLKDLSMMLTTWLVNYALPAPVPK
jgi:outer membrane protein assembly factor BamB